jgi:hypothetical protein
MSETREDMHRYTRGDLITLWKGSEAGERMAMRENAQLRDQIRDLQHQIYLLKQKTED